MAKYKITLTFESDFDLEQVQIDDLVDSLNLQIQEPQTWKGERENYETSNINIEIEQD
jgi:hypothetical protein